MRVKVDFLLFRIMRCSLFHSVFFAQSTWTDLTLRLGRFTCMIVVKNNSVALV
jgi:hypothetical protein